ncbi:uncharacterized protein LOC129762860 [Toxorhynchites rutilus septentrionalis]|uniref:uncharacterized protein LOC129762860 n=1 Tax=Toxorhynchites rutilus septentrionalis TaxID=329112 RepID=UPI00247846FA|nr:uncharacterized protein LOC129762860 [Toxorhynchites rutilus septentrionalis]
MASTIWYPPQQRTQLPEGHHREKVAASAAHRLCRLCLSKEQRLEPLFPPDGMPNETLLQRILNCLTIALTFDEDFDTYICFICIQEVTKFYFYKEQCLANDSILRSRQKHADGYAEEEKDDCAVVERNNGQADTHDSEVDYSEGELIDSDEFDVRDVEDDNEESVQRGFFRSPRIQMEPQFLKPLPKQRARRENVQDYYHGGFRYTCASTRANGNVHWRCMYKSKLKCRAAIQVAPNGTVTRGPNRHNHHPEKQTERFPVDGTITDLRTGRQVSYQLINSGSRMQLVCDGYKYWCARTTKKQTTYWRCMKHSGKLNCRAVLSIGVDFSSCTTNGYPHNHPAQIDMVQTPLSNCGALSRQERNGENSNLQMMQPMNGHETTSKPFNPKSKWNVMIHKGYDFGFPRIERKNTKWSCFKKSSFNCPANVYTDWSGKVIRESDWAHNHKQSDDYDGDAIIEGYMQHIKTKESIFYKLIPGKRGQRFVLYKGYRYSSDRLVRDGRIAWKCTKCKVFIVVGGRFGTIEERGGDHGHPTQDDDDATCDTSYYADQQSNADLDSEQTQDDEHDMEFSVKIEPDDDERLKQYDEEEDDGDQDEVDDNDDEDDAEDDEDDDDEDEDYEDEQIIIPDVSIVSTQRKTRGK